MKLFNNGGNRAIRIPKDFEFDGDEATIRKDGDRLIVEPVREGSLLEVLASLKPLNEPFPDIDDDDLPPLDEPEL
mgnify:CR=1 FL=1